MDLPNTIEGSIKFDLTAIKAAISVSEDLESDSNTILEQLVKIDDAKKQLKELNELFAEAETQVKDTINVRAKALYGDNWDAIKGDGYKISRSGTGAAYVVDTELEEEATQEEKVGWLMDNPDSLSFLKIDIKADKDLVENHIKDTNKLPSKIIANPERGEAIRITVKKQ